MSLVHFAASDGKNATPVSAADPMPVTIPAGDLNIGNVDVASIAAGDNNIGNVDIVGASACSITSVGDETSSTELLAANAARKAARIVNDSSAILYVACGEAASASNYTAKLSQDQGVTIEGYTGAINGLWASDAGGNARISEFS